MHPETKKLTQKNMPYLTLTANLKLQLSPGLVASYNIQPVVSSKDWTDQNFNSWE